MTIQRLNMDNSWFIQLNELKLLVDPWLEGTEVDYFKWFNTQWHRTSPISYEQLPVYNTVLITQIYPDHFHEQTLLKLNPSRVVAPKSLYKRLKLLLPNAEIIKLCNAQPEVVLNQVKIQLLPQPKGIGPVFMAYLISGSNESALVAPHGYKGNYESKSVDSKIDLILTPFNRYTLPFYLGGTLAPGIAGLRRLTKKYNPKYLVSTHDEDKHATGLVSKLARVVNVSSSELNSDEMFKNKILEVNHYKPVEL